MSRSPMMGHGGFPLRAVPSPVAVLVAFAVPAALALLAPGGHALTYTDAARDAGVLFQRAGNPDDPNPSFVELMGGGACWLDYDRDGEQDLFLVDGWYNSTTLAASEHAHSRLYRNLGNGRFEDVTAQAGLNVTGWTQGCSAADYNGDGWTDLFVQGYGIQSLFRNNGDGTFTNVTAASGITAAGKCPGEPCWGTSSAWADYDRDGCLDLVVGNFVRYNMTLGGKRSPSFHDAQGTQLYHNNCDGTFTDVTRASGATGDPGWDGGGKVWSVAWLDYNRDGWPDLYLTSDGTPGLLYRNNGNGTFTETAHAAGVDDPRNGMGLTIGDCNDDGYEDLFRTHYSSDPPVPYLGLDGFYVNNGNGTFRDRSGAGDLADDLAYVKWGAGFQDFDNDGKLDLHVVTGHTEPPAVIENADSPPFLWLGDGKCGFTDVSRQLGPDFQLKRLGRGQAYADYDHDGILDIVQVNLLREPTLLLRGSNATGHWLTLQLRQPGGNPAGVFADVNVTLPDGRVLHHRFNPYQGIHGSNALEEHIGLGEATSANVTVRWPQDLAETTFPGLAADQVLRLHRDGSVDNDTLAPRTTVLVDGAPWSRAWSAHAVRVSLQAQDRGTGFVSGVAHTYATLDGVASTDPAGWDLGEGAHELRVHSVDRAGNAELEQARVVGVDTAAPTGSLSLQGTLLDGWYRGPVNVTLACRDALSGVGSATVSTDGGPPQAYAAPFAFTRPGAHTLAWTCTDLAGNAAQGSASFQLDLGAPQTVARFQGVQGNADWWRSAVNVTLDAAGGLRNVTRVRVAVDGGAVRDATGPVRVDAEGRHALRFWAEDDAGRVEAEQSLAFGIDATPPTLGLDGGAYSVDEPQGLVVGPGNTVLPVASDAGSGVVRVEVRHDEPGALWSIQRPSHFYGAGAHPFQARAWDAAGNLGFLQRDVLVDESPPVITIAKPLDQSVNLGSLAVQSPLRVLRDRAVLVGSVPFQEDASDALAGVASVDILVEGVLEAHCDAPTCAWTWDLPADAQRTTYHVTYRATDRVRNFGEATFTVLALGPLPAGPPLGSPPPPEPEGLMWATVATFATAARRPQP